ncbi:MAG: DUF885 domain-containing protein [Candidatus Thiodiazotropha endolucinida]|nr:DUF885 domain-containing protein [Candidatus Thiodiazotropha taylori]MCG8120940.1 DUF885 domain-containing protein [Candidatus Thiodiazotropha taylori]MCW4287621.1 DUF885 domain-containing protein [Candidatus Thiodiazotropha endolucinida]MCW4296631.1 DUF885 domain-containing protein [Candidatus Thiodiazotropha endolucinida]
MSNNEAAAFDSLIADYYRVWFRFHPVAAVYASVPGYEGLLAADGDDDMGALANLISNLLVSLKELDYDALDADRQLDLQLIYGTAMVEHRLLLEHDWRHRDPARYLPLHLLQELVVRQPEKLCEALMGVLEKTPNYLRDARGRLGELPGLVSTLWLADALETAEKGVPWLKRLGRDLPQTHECCADKGRLQSLSSQAAEAVDDFKLAMIKDLTPSASGTADCGKELLAWLLRHRDQIDIRVEDALAYARRRLHQTYEELERQGISLQAVKQVKGEQLNGDNRLQAYREEAAGLRSFLQWLEILPDSPQPLAFRITDSCFRQPDCGSYLRTQQGGVFLIPHDQQVGGGESRSAIRMRNLYSSWAGRHYLAWAGGVSAHSLVRQINPSAAFKRGWAHYMSRILEGHGYFTENDRLSLYQRRLALAEQATIDLEFHAGEINSRQALERLKRLSDIPCWAEVSLTAISRRPTDAFMALLGAELIEHLCQRQLEQRPGSTLRSLHEELLAHGAVALPLVVQRACDRETWEQALNEVLS